jgi:HEAT repeat protein
MRKSFLTVAVLLAGLVSGCGPHEPTGQKVLGPPPGPPPYPQAKIVPIDRGLQDRARQELDADLKFSDEVIRAHAMEVVKNAALPDAGPILLVGLNDQSPLVRKAAALACGELREQSAQDRLEAMIDTATLQERMAIIFALHRIGDTRFTHEYEKTAIDPDPRVRDDTALMLGMLGEKSAIPILLQMQKEDKDPTVRLEAAGALWKLGDERGLDDLVGATISAYPDDQMVALLAIAGPHDMRSQGHIDAQLTADYTEVALVAARAAGILGSDRGYGVAMIGARSADPRQRLLAALAFADIGRSDAQPILGGLLADKTTDVRLAAAGALLQINQGKKSE